MKRRKRRETGETDLFRSRLGQIITMSHELMLLSMAASWETIEARCVELHGMMPLPTRQMEGMTIIKHAECAGFMPPAGAPQVLSTFLQRRKRNQASYQIIR